MRRLLVRAGGTPGFALLGFTLPAIALGACVACSEVDSSGLFSTISSVEPSPDLTLDAGHVAQPSASDAGARPPLGPPKDAGLADADSGDPPPPPPLIIGVPSADDDSACTLPAVSEANAAIFSGSTTLGICRINLDAPYGTFWYAFENGSRAGAAVNESVSGPGCNDAMPCSLYARGPATDGGGFSSSAGVGFTLRVGSTPLDVKRFQGIQFWARGSISGTRGPSNSPSPQTLFLKLVTTTERSGDDFGAYCSIDPTRWSLCQMRFAELARDGYAPVPGVAGDRLDLERVIRVEFDFRVHDGAGDAAAGAGAVAFDVALAAISFF